MTLHRIVALCCAGLVLVGVASAARADTSASDESIYQLRMTLTDQDNHRHGLDVYRGHQVVIALFYATCNHTCPLLIAALKSLDAKLNASARKDIRYLLVSLDPGQDTPKALKALAARHRLDLHRWKLTNTSEDKVRELANVLGITYRKNAAGGFNHSSVVTLLDQRGQIVRREEGINQATQAIGEHLNKKKEGKHEPKKSARSAPAK
jgi:protein SCO1/2